MTQERAANIVDLILREFGVTVGFDQSSANREMGTVQKIVLAQNPRRLAFVVINLSANNLFLAPGSNVGADKGIFIGANGGSLSMTFREDLILPALEWNGVASANNTDIFVMEVVMT